MDDRNFLLSFRQNTWRLKQCKVSLARHRWWYQSWDRWDWYASCKPGKWWQYHDGGVSHLNETRRWKFAKKWLNVQWRFSEQKGNQE